jgi:predicted Zn-dependent protease
MQAIARHEIGHLLGLDHTADDSNIMSANVRVPELSEADRNTVRLVYKLPPGSVRAP